MFPTVQATDRLTYDDARRLAQKTVWKCYQVAGIDASGSGPIVVPGYGKLVRRQQLVLQDTKVEQITPKQNDSNVIDAYTHRPATLELYDSYSKDQPAIVIGSVYNSLDNGLWYTNAAPNKNTQPDSRVVVPFAVDPVWQVVTFSNYVYYYAGSPSEYRALEPILVLETAVNVRNPVTNALERYTEIRPLAGSATQTNPAISHHEDLQLEVYASYEVQWEFNKDGVSLKSNAHKPGQVFILEADPLARADYYLKGMALEYEWSGGEVRGYNGLVAIDLDGAVTQVSWHVGEQGAYTVASRNGEHDWLVPSYPERRRRENLAAAGQNPQWWQVPRIELPDPE